VIANARSGMTAALRSARYSTGGPSLFVHGSQLKMIYRAASQNRLVMSTYNGSTYGTPVTIGSYLGTGRDGVQRPDLRRLLHEPGAAHRSLQRVVVDQRAPLPGDQLR
jgi:hypothetical protein